MHLIKALGLISTLAYSATALPVAAPVYQIEYVTEIVTQYADGTVSTAAVNEVSTYAAATPTATSVPVGAYVATSAGYSLSTSTEAVAAESTATAGDLEIVNNLDVPVYAAIVTDVQGETQSIVSNSSWNHGWSSYANGVSIKLSTNPEPSDDPLQMEYTKNSVLWYDLSAINLSKESAFYEYGFKLMGASGTDNCQNVICPAGDSNCKFVYQHWNDNNATHACPLGTKLVLTLGLE